MTVQPHSAPATSGPLDFLLTGLVQQVTGVRFAVVVSEDGLVVSKSASFPRPEAERLAATVSGLMSLGRGVCVDFDGGSVVQSLLEMRNGFLILTSAGAGTHLAVLTEGQADVGVVAFEMNMLIKKVGEHLSAAPRSDFSAPQGVHGFER